MTCAFVTKFSLSSKSAIGVQTRAFRQAVPGSIHLYWERRDASQFTDSYCLNSFIAARFAVAQRVPKLLRLLGLTAWTSNSDLTFSWRSKLRRLTAGVECIYLAPIDRHDSARMRSIVHEIDKPFVLHLWDLLDSTPSGDINLLWLIKNATSVFGLTPALCQATGRKDASLLLFTRVESRHVGLPPQPGEVLRVGVVGDVVSYVRGLELLLDAQARAAGLIKVFYIGPAGLLRRLDKKLRDQMEILGFSASDEGRDIKIAGCHIGFLPGPYESPQNDARSRYSIPSRILDYMAIRLPIVGMVNRDSATAWLAERCNLSESLYNKTSEELLSSLLKLRDRANWLTASERSYRSYLALRGESPIDILRSALSRAAGNSPRAKLIDYEA